MNKYNTADFTFWGLFSHGAQVDTLIKTLGYVVALVDSPENEALNLEKARFILSYLFAVEEQVTSPADLLSVQERSFPAAYLPQTPVMLTLRWSPISAMLERGWQPIKLSRETTGMACASGVWAVRGVEDARSFGDCRTPEELFWHILQKVVEKARMRNLLISIIARPGWSYETDVGMLRNLSSAAAGEADRVIWQRAPNTGTH
jgi:hypothetical protein